MRRYSATAFDCRLRQALAAAHEIAARLDHHAFTAASGQLDGEA
jgi:hypothetical protein